MIAPWNLAIWNDLTQGQPRNTHAWLFTGPQGLGKLDLAVDYARFLLGNPDSFDRISSPDFHALAPEQQLGNDGTLLQQYGMRYYTTAAGQKPKAVISVEQVRAINAALVTHAHGRHKVVLISPAHQMNINAANALLKVLEEPPTHTIFLLVSDRPDLLPATVRSRCSLVHFRTPPRAQALGWLSGQVEGEHDLSLLLNVAGGAPLQAVTMAQTGFLEGRGRVLDDMQRLLSNSADVISVGDGWKDVEAGQVLGILRSVLVDLVRVRLHAAPPYLFNPDRLDWLQHAAKRIHLNKAFALMDRIGVHLQDINTPLDRGLVTADFLLDLTDITR